MRPSPPPCGFGRWRIREEEKGEKKMRKERVKEKG
jgi:ribosomal protein L37E